MRRGRLLLFFLKFLLQLVQEFLGRRLGKNFVRQLRNDCVRYHQKIQVHVIEKSSDLIQLNARGAEDLGTRREIVDHSNRKDLYADELLEITGSAFIAARSNESDNRILVFISQLPPVRAHLANV